MSWRWECDPSEEHVIGGAPPVFVAEVEKTADELVRAAEARYLDGTLFQGGTPRASMCAFLAGCSSSFISRATNAYTSSR